LEASAQGREIGELIDNPWSKLGSLPAASLVYVQKGELASAFDCLSEYRILSRQTGSAFLISTTSEMLCIVYLALGAYELGIEDANQIFVEVDDIPDIIRQQIKIQMARLYIGMGRLDLANENYSAALREADKQLELVRHYGVRAILPESLYLRGMALLGLDRLHEAFETLDEANSLAAELNTSLIHWQILASLSLIENQRGNLDKAKSLQQHAQGIVTYIADHCGRDEYRDIFMSRPDVQALIGANQPDVS
jgi:tetratricopeptide (TPR) repeat protein